MPVLRFAEADVLWFAGVNRLFCEEANVRVAVAFGWPARAAMEKMLSSVSRFDALLAIANQHDSQSDRT
jgi:hypothetical protein